MHAVGPRFFSPWCLLAAVMVTGLSGCVMRRSPEPGPSQDEGPHPDGECAVAKGPACTFLGQIASRDFATHESENDAVRAITWLAKGCRFQDAQGCLEWGLFLQRLDSEPTLVKQGRSLIKLACDRGLPDGCATLGEQFKDGISGPRNRQEAMALFAKACDMGSARGCYLEGTSWFSGWGGPIDLVRARLLHQQGCDGGVGEACLGLAGMLFRGEGGPEDDEAAARMADRACTLGLKYACLDRQDEEAPEEP